MDEKDARKAASKEIAAKFGLTPGQARFDLFQAAITTSRAIQTTPVIGPQDQRAPDPLPGPPIAQNQGVVFAPRPFLTAPLSQPAAGPGQTEGGITPPSDMIENVVVIISGQGYVTNMLTDGTLTPVP